MDVLHGTYWRPQRLRDARIAYGKPHLPSLFGECTQAVQGWKLRLPEQRCGGATAGLQYIVT